LDFHRWLSPDSNYKYRGTVADWKVDKAADLASAAPLTQSATQAAELVLAQAGASLQRDAVDKRVVDNVRNRQGKVIDRNKKLVAGPRYVPCQLPWTAITTACPTRGKRHMAWTRMMRPTGIATETEMAIPTWKNT